MDECAVLCVPVHVCESSCNRGLFVSIWLKNKCASVTFIITSILNSQTKLCFYAQKEY